MNNYLEYRLNDIVNRINRMSVYPLDVMLTGVTGAGKSSTINGIFNADMASIGYGVDPETQDVSSYSINQYMRVWDTPGLGDGVVSDQIHTHKIRDMLKKTYLLDQRLYGWIDMVIVILDGSSKDMYTAYKLLEEVVYPNITSDRVLIAINQADFAMKGRGWLGECPDENLSNFLRSKEDSIISRIHKKLGVNIVRPISYSAKFSYNIDAFIDMIITEFPKRRRIMEGGVGA
jgi:uncharacterized protein